MQRLYLYDYTTTHGALTLESLHEHCTEELSILNDEFPDELDLSGFLELYGVKIYCNTTRDQIPADKPIKVRGYWVLQEDGSKLLPARLPARQNYILG